jgi:hypothetical protein
VKRRERERLDRLERNGAMDRRRAELRTWFEAHPEASPSQAIKELGYSHPDHMYVVADSIRIDMIRGQSVAP